MGAAVEASVPEKELQAEVFAVLIGVDLAHQRKGYGSVLLQHALSQCARDHAPAYLESSNPANIPLYERHGSRSWVPSRSDRPHPFSRMLRPAR